VTVLAHLDALETALGRKKWPALTPWWRETFEHFYPSGRRQLVLRVGRRGGKSSSLCRVAVLEALFGEHTIAPGDVGVVAIVSVSRDEAGQRLRTIKAILDALRVKWRPIEGGIELADRPIAFKTYTASIAGVSGFSCIAAICDEVAKWRDSDTGANPASEVLASLRPTLAGQPHAKIFLSSSPMGKQDAHAVAFDQGETEFQETASAQTWVARPTLTEAMCRELEPDPDTFAREYGIIPFDGSTLSIFTGPMLEAVTRIGPPVTPPEPGVQYVAAQDPANRGGNGWTLAIVRTRRVDADLATVEVVLTREWRARRGAALDSDATLSEISGVLSEYGITELWQDQWSYDSLAALATRHGIELRQQPSTQSSKVQTFEALRRRVTDRTISFPDDPMVRADLLGVRKWISKGGAFSIELERAGGRHSDHAPSIALAVHKAVEDDAAPTFVEAMRLARLNGFFGGPARSAPKPAPIPDYPTTPVEKTSAWEHKQPEQSEWGKLANTLAGGEEPREKPPGAVEVDIGPGGGRCTGTGVWYSMRATWQGRSGAAEFSANASSAFRAEVLRKASAAGHVIT